jgi:hypothetical protein
MLPMGACRLVAWTKYHFIVGGSCCYFGVTMNYVHAYNTDGIQLISL